MAAYPSASFYYPPSVFFTPLVFNVLDSVNVSWTSTFPDLGVILYLFCVNPAGHFIGVPATPSNVPPKALPDASYAVNLTQVGLGLGNSGSAFTGCHFQLELAGDGNGNNNNSEGFILNRNQSHQPITWGLSMTESSSSFSLSSVSLTTASLTTASLTTSTLTTSSLTTSSINTVIASSSYVMPSSIITASSAVPPSASSSGNTGSALISQHRVSTITVAGITVGITLTLVGLLIVLGILLRRLRAKRATIGILKTTAVRLREDVNANAMEGDFMPSELSATERDAELDGTPLNELQGCEPLE